VKVLLEINVMLSKKSKRKKNTLTENLEENGSDF
jgi:hypothetical protein